MNDLLQVIINGLTYAGNWLDSLINYGLIVIMLMPFLVPAKRADVHPAHGWLGCFLIALVVQVLLWFSADAVGVSVLWATIAGYGLMLRMAASEAFATGHRRLLLAALLCAVVGILYYALTLPLITTVAHGIAVALGIGIFYLLHILNTRSSAGRAG